MANEKELQYCGSSALCFIFLLFLFQSGSDVAESCDKPKYCREEEKCDSEGFLEQQGQNSDIEGKSNKFAKLVGWVDDPHLIDNDASKNHESLSNTHENQDGIGNHIGDGIGDNGCQKHQLIGQGVHDGTKRSHQIVLSCQISIQEI